jgi:mono/diheme cytochrome c family protein
MRLTTTLLLGCALAASTASTSALAASIARGKTLYETKCHACHDRSVHNRKARKAKSVQSIRREVVRWDDALGGGWTKEEVDDVTVYLNETYYRFRCPDSLCPQQQSMSGPALR